ncbi:cytochrome P450 3A9-like [Ptychodera flava]|uniref:cytochrome P450 3A9-like n=1 Tax=Ptychodera flava TaxID=63121 RepID=UPI00396A7B66
MAISDLTFDLGLTSVPVTTILLTIVIIFLMWISVSAFSVLSHTNLPGPTPWPFVGSFFALHGGPQYHINITNLIKKYGEIFCCYEGRKPTIVVADPDMLKQILVKEFHKFQNRHHALGSPKRTNPVFGQSVLFLEDRRWKEVRTILTPAFSAAKMKEMSPFINAATSQLLNALESHKVKGDSFNLWKVFGNYTLDVIAAAAFGIDIETQKDLNNQFIQKSTQIVGSFLFKSVRFFVTSVFPFLIPPTAALVMKQRKPMFQFFEDIMDELLDSRQIHGSERRDFCQLLLEAAEQTSSGKEIANGFSSKSMQKTKLTRIEMKAQIMVFLLAAFDTTTNTLAYCCYLLARHPEIQERLIQEVDDALKGETNLDYNSVQKLPYMEMVISETQRLYPAAFRVNRKCLESCTINGVHFPKGIQVDIPIYGIHHNPQFWPDPEKFDPERFTPEAKAVRNPYTFLPFSHGPRNCIGMRFAQLEMKIALSRVLQKYKFTTSPKTEVPLKLEVGITMTPTNGIHLKVIDRDEKVPV